MQVRAASNAVLIVGRHFALGWAPSVKTLAPLVAWIAAARRLCVPRRRDAMDA